MIKIELFGQWTNERTIQYACHPPLGFWVGTVNWCWLERELGAGEDWRLAINYDQYTARAKASS